VEGFGAGNGVGVCLYEALVTSILVDRLPLGCQACGVFFLGGHLFGLVLVFISMFSVCCGSGGLC